MGSLYAFGTYVYAFGTYVHYDTCRIKFRHQIKSSLYHVMPQVMIEDKYESNCDVHVKL